GAQRLDFRHDLAMAFTQPGQLQSVAGDVADAQDRAAADGAALDFEMAPPKARERRAKTFTAAAQALDALLHLLRGRWRQPDAEAEHPPRDRRVHHERQIAFDFGFARRR